MPGIWALWTRHAEAIRWISLGVGVFVALSGAAFLGWRMFRHQPTPEEIERRRRSLLSGEGKIGDGEIVDVEGSVILYSYSVGGVEYMVGQDASSIEALLPRDRMRMVGPASVRFDPKNPANSIVLGEQWSGLRLRTVPEERAVSERIT
jgi:hypothetical protein